jgi:hypothetical protein
MKYHNTTNWNQTLQDGTLSDKNEWTCNSNNSNYHFDSSRTDNPGDYFKVLGYVDLSDPAWQQEIDWIETRCIYERTPEMINMDTVHNTVKNLDYTSGLYQNKDKQSSKGYGHGLSPEMFPLLSSLEDVIGLRHYKSDYAKKKQMPSSARIISQCPGQMFQIHVDDELWKLADPDPSQVVRLVIMLTPWKAGQMYQYGTGMYEGWRAGEVHVFDWPNVPHSTANCSKWNRHSLQFTGYKTQKYTTLFERGHKDYKIQ